LNHIKKSISIVGVAISSLVLFGGAINFLFDIGFSSLEPYLIIALIIFVLAYIFSILELKKLSVSATEKSYLEEFVLDFETRAVEDLFDQLYRGSIHVNFYNEVWNKIDRHSEKHNELINRKANKAKAAFIKCCVEMDGALEAGSELKGNAILFTPKTFGHNEEIVREYNLKYNNLKTSYNKLRGVFKNAYPWLEWK
jgi:hypothetical protein